MQLKDLGLGAALVIGLLAPQVSHAAGSFECPWQPIADKPAASVAKLLPSANALADDADITATITELRGQGLSSGLIVDSIISAYCPAVVAETDGVRLLGDDILTRATEVQSEGAPYFAVPGPWPRWGMGFQLDSEARRYLGDASLGHDGAGGQVAFADRDAKVGFAFLTNRMEAVDDRATRIVDALRAVL